MHQSSLAQRRSHQPACILLWWLCETFTGKYHEAGAKPVPERQRQKGCVTATGDDACVCFRADTVHNFVCSSKRSRTCLMSASLTHVSAARRHQSSYGMSLMAVENCSNIVPISDSISFQYPARHSSNIRLGAYRSNTGRYLLNYFEYVSINNCATAYDSLFSNTLITTLHDLCIIGKQYVVMYA